MQPSKITVSRSKRGTTVKATGKAAQAVFDAMAGQVHAGLASNLPGAYTIQFEDHGQDFLEWDVNTAGRVVGCRPAQAWVWVGAQVLQRPKPGEVVRCSTTALVEPMIRYPVSKITQAIEVAP